MTFFEHAMLGGTLALAVGLHRRHGCHIVVMAGVASMLPDWDGLTLVFGGAAYDMTHRIWGHNVFVAATLGGLCGAAECLGDFTGRVQRLLNRRAPSLVSPRTDPLLNSARCTIATLAIWFITGAAGSLSHLGVDLLYASHPHMQDWPLQLLWPFSRRNFAYPIVQWGDVGATGIFVVEMFALYRWPRLARMIASLTLGVVLLYVCARLTMTRM